MNGLDLTAAADAAQPLIDTGGYIYETPKAEDVIRAALPHILEALAKVADAEVDDAGQFANRWARDAAAAARWLAKITEAAP